MLCVFLLLILLLLTFNGVKTTMSSFDPQRSLAYSTPLGRDMIESLLCCHAIFPLDFTYFPIA